MPYTDPVFDAPSAAGDAVELTSKPYPAHSWEHARGLADAFSYEDVRIAVSDHYQHGREEGISHADVGEVTGANRGKADNPS